MSNSISLGKPLDLTDEELDLLSEVTDEDILNARKFILQDVGDEFIAELLDTTEVTE